MVELGIARVLWVGHRHWHHWHELLLGLVASWWHHSWHHLRHHWESSGHCWIHVGEERVCGGVLSGPGSTSWCIGLGSQMLLHLHLLSKHRLVLLEHLLVHHHVLVHHLLLFHHKLLATGGITSL
jgi:hypothetical protein